jgi:hypothetical protein
MSSSARALDVTRQISVVGCASIFGFLVITSFALSIYLDLAIFALTQGSIDLPPSAVSLAGMISSDVRTLGSSIWFIASGATTALVFGNALGAGPMVLAWGSTINLCLSLIGTVYILGG